MYYEISNLSPSQIKEIRNEYLNGASLKYIQKVFDLTYAQVRGIVHNLTVKYKDPDYIPPTKDHLINHKDDILRMKSEGKTIREMLRYLQHEYKYWTTDRNIRLFLEKIRN